MSTPRRLEIQRLIAERDIHSQSHLVDLLAASGHTVTQATVSRDLRAIGAVKGDGGAYRLGSDGSPGHPDLRQALDRYADRVALGDGLVVVHTPPGAAQVTAQAIDAAGLPGVAGTVAGDDTILVVTVPGVAGSEIADVLASREAP